MKGKLLLELMSNGTLAELPPDNAPDGLFLPDMPEEPSVILLLPHNKYLLGTGHKGSDKWIYASDKPGARPQNVFLYDNEILSLTNEGTQPTILPAQTVTELRKELFMQTEPPGRHSATVLLLRTFMRNNPALMSEDASFLDEKIFAQAMKKDIVLYKAYWTLRFALARNEMEEVGRLKAWLKADPEVFTNPKYTAKIWFSLLGLPGQEAISELEELSFSRLELRRMAEQNISPVMIYNPMSGWLILGSFGRDRQTMFFAWAYFNHDMWAELREKKKMTVSEIISALWGELDTRQAVNERAKYKGDDIRI